MDFSVFQYIQNICSIKPGYKLLLGLQLMWHTNINSVTILMISFKILVVLMWINSHSMRIG